MPGEQSRPPSSRCERAQRADEGLGYLIVESRTDKATLDAALTSGTVIEVHANHALVAATAIVLLPSLFGRMAQAHDNGNIKFARFRNPPNFEKLNESCESYLAASISLMLGDVFVSPTIIAFPTMIDAITGT